MNSLNLRLPSKRVGYIATALMLMLTLATSAFVSAAQVTLRSIELSSSTKAATNVSYKINFTSVGAAGAFTVDFCSNTPLIGQTCTAPTGFNATSAASATSGFTDTEDIDSNTIRSVGTIGAATAISVDVTGITNPTNAGPLYARILTYTNEAGAEGYTDTNPSAVAAPIDTGSVALSITDTIGVTGDVLETMTFCVSGGDNITAGCGGTLTAPTLEIGELSGSVRALTSSALSTAPVYTQISTNAASGAIVSLKSNTTGCGGLSRLGAASFAAGCGIAAAGTTGTVAAGDAKFGVRTATATDEGTATGAFQPKGGSVYDNTNYRFNYVAGDATGVTSTYGDPLLDTNSAPVSNKEMVLTFGASIAPNTPAGRYTANLSLIATGKF